MSSIFGTHNGTITPTQTITVQKIYTYPCTGGHTEYARIWNLTLNVTVKWDGYKEDWPNLSFKEPFRKRRIQLHHIRTGAYPQIHHADALPTANGGINCTQFRDTNGKRYRDWIPAIRLA